MSDVKRYRMYGLDCVGYGKFEHDEGEWVKAADYDALLAELEAIRGQEQVAEVSAETFSSDGTSDIITANLPIGTKLYALPPQQPDAVSVPRELAKRLAGFVGAHPSGKGLAEELRALLTTKTDGVV